MSKGEYARVHGLKISTLRWWSSHYPHWSRHSDAADRATATERRRDTDEAEGTGTTQHFLTVAASEHGADAQPESLRLTLGCAAPRSRCRPVSVSKPWVGCSPPRSDGLTPGRAH